MYLCVLRSVMIVLLACTAVNAQSTDEQVTMLLRATDIEQEIEQIPDFIADEAMSPELGFSPEQTSAFVALMRQAYDPKTVLESVRTYIRERFDAEYSEQLVKALYSPLADRVHETERKAMEVDDMELDNYISRMEFNPPTDKRMELIERYGVLTGKIDIPLDLIIGVTRGFFTVQAFFEEGAPPDEEAVDLALGMEQIDLHEDLQNLFTVKSLYTFRNTPDADLVAYIQIWESEAGRRFVTLSNAGLRTALKEAADRALEMAK